MENDPQLLVLAAMVAVLVATTASMMVTPLATKLVKFLERCNKKTLGIIIATEVVGIFAVILVLRSLS